MALPDVYIDPAEAVDWRDAEFDDSVPDDDEVLHPTPAYVVAMLGFDPLDEEVDKAKADAPNYAPATTESTCVTCIHGGDGYCDSFHFTTNSTSVCSAHEPLTPRFDKYTPPREVQVSAAKAVKEYKANPEATDIGNESIMLLAADIANGRPLDKDQLRTMLDYLTAHYEVADRNSWTQHGAEWQEWFGLGGRAGLSWTRRVLRQVEKRSDLELEAGKTETLSGFRRQGIATKLYDAVEGVAGQKLKPSGLNSPASQSFWSARSSATKQVGKYNDLSLEFNMESSNISFAGTISKVDDEKHQVFGWANLISKDGVALSDSQGDELSADELEKTAYEFVSKVRNLGVMHKAKGLGTLIESLVLTKEKAAAMGIELPNGNEGWWTGFQVTDPGTWDRVKKGELREFSIHGVGIRTPIE